jgi:hypothetical protein
MPSERRGPHARFLTCSDSERRPAPSYDGVRRNRARSAQGAPPARHPRNYEIWYTYATGDQPSLNQTINDLLQKKGNLSEADLQSVLLGRQGRPRRAQEDEQQQAFSTPDYIIEQSHAFYVSWSATFHARE